MTTKAQSRRAPTATPAALRPALIGLVVLGLLAAAPQLNITIPGVLPGPLSSPGGLQVVAVALVFAGLAVSYDIVFGYAGLFSFGHALFFGIGIYGTNLLMLRAELPYALAALLAVTAGTTVAAIAGAVALRLNGIAFAMVTLAFLEVFTIIILTDKFHFSGGDEGMALALNGVPDQFRGVFNYGNVYYTALGYAAVTLIAATIATRSHAGRVWLAIRDNETRAETLGVWLLPVKLLAFVVGGALASLGGAVYLIVVRGASPLSISVDFSLAILLMVILGGAGRLWGALIGGAVYAILQLRLPALAASDAFNALPGPVGEIASEPLFILGVIFTLVVLVAPGGIAGAFEQLTRKKVDQ